MQVHHVTDRCLVSHSPSPQLCALRGGAWDDSTYNTFAGGGGRCMEGGVAEAQAYLAEAEGQGLGQALELVEVEVSHDGQGG